MIALELSLTSTYLVLYIMPMDVEQREIESTGMA